MYVGVGVAVGGFLVTGATRLVPKNMLFGGCFPVFCSLVNEFHNFRALGICRVGFALASTQDFDLGFFVASGINSHDTQNHEKRFDFVGSGKKMLGANQVFYIPMPEEVMQRLLGRLEEDTTPHREQVARELTHQVAALQDNLQHAMRILPNVLADPALMDWAASLHCLLSDSAVLAAAIGIDEKQFVARAHALLRPVERATPAACMICADEGLQMTMDCCGAQQHVICMLKHYFASSGDLFKTAGTCAFCRCEFRITDVLTRAPPVPPPPDISRADATAPLGPARKRSRLPGLPRR